MTTPEEEMAARKALLMTIAKAIMDSVPAGTAPLDVCAAIAIAYVNVCDLGGISRERGVEIMHLVAEVPLKS